MKCFFMDSKFFTLCYIYQELDTLRETYANLDGTLVS